MPPASPAGHDWVKYLNDRGLAELSKVLLAWLLGLGQATIHYALSQGHLNSATGILNMVQGCLRHP